MSDGQILVEKKFLAELLQSAETLEKIKTLLTSSPKGAE